MEKKSLRMKIRRLMLRKVASIDEEIKELEESKEIMEYVYKHLH